MCSRTRPARASTARAGYQTLGSLHEPAHAARSRSARGRAALVHAAGAGGRAAGAAFVLPAVAVLVDGVPAHLERLRVDGGVVVVAVAAGRIPAGRARAVAVAVLVAG